MTRPHHLPRWRCLVLAVVKKQGHTPFIPHPVSVARAVWGAIVGRICFPVQRAMPPPPWGNRKSGDTCRFLQETGTARNRDRHIFRAPPSRLGCTLGPHPHNCSHAPCRTLRSSWLSPSCHPEGKPAAADFLQRRGLCALSRSAAKRVHAVRCGLLGRPALKKRDRHNSCPSTSAPPGANRTINPLPSVFRKTIAPAPCRDGGVWYWLG